MTEQTSLLDSLTALSREVGAESRHLAILGEGNTSADCGDATFWVKASGAQLGTITPADFSRVDLNAAMRYMRRNHMDDDEVRQALEDVLVDRRHRRPSVETFFHAVCYAVGGAKWVAHTHPVSCNAILCSQLGAQPFRRHLFPDGIVVCGRHVAVAPYVDPGFLLAKVFETEIKRFQDEHGISPKLVLMENHGITALGQTAQEALNIQLMADKWARIILGAYALGGPNFLPDFQMDRIENRPDEHYRRRQLVHESSG